MVVMEKIREALDYAVNNTNLFTMSYKGKTEFNIEGIYEKINEFLENNN